jgi:hypothetical protein
VRLCCLPALVWVNMHLVGLLPGPQSHHGAHKKMHPTCWLMISSGPAMCLDVALRQSS